MVIKESHMTWHPINSHGREEIANIIEVGHLNLQDNIIFHVWDLTERNDKIFNIRQVLKRPYEYKDNVHLCLNFEMQLNLIEYDREVYTTLDWFGNLGGLSEGLKILFGLLIGVLNYHMYSAYMVAALFKVSERKEDHERGIERKRTSII